MLQMHMVAVSYRLLARVSSSAYFTTFMSVLVYQITPSDFSTVGELKRAIAVELE